jgi:hypothetical protein
VLTIPVAAFLFIGDIMADSLSDLEYKYYSSVVASDGAVTISIEPSAVAQISSRTATSISLMRMVILFQKINVEQLKFFRTTIQIYSYSGFLLAIGE